jgi:hypothetical protein
MKKHFSWSLPTLLLFSIAIISWKPINANKHDAKAKSGSLASVLLEKYADNIYETAHLQETGLDFGVFKKAVTGFINLKTAKKEPVSNAILTICDLSRSSTEKRMWIIDMVSKSLVLNTWVAHGRGSGENWATNFSDREESHASSLGFYVTDDIYYGKNGRSLRLDGLDEGFNTHARARAIVIHAADYVNPNIVSKIGYLGRSYGCPAVAPEVAELVLDVLKEKTVLFINGNNIHYNSKYLDEEIAANSVLKDGNVSGL